MKPYRLLLIVACLLLLWIDTAKLTRVEPVFAQQPIIDTAIQAVVRILPQRCGPAGCRQLGVGSGAIIHPSGVILTAWHVTVEDPSNLVSPVYADDFVIEWTDDVQRRPQPRYRAELLAVKPAMDLALLRIYQDERTGTPIPLEFDSDLPTLPLSTETPRSGQLWIVGYPPAGGGSVKYPTFSLSGFADEGALLTVQGTLSEGYSGGPALVERGGEFQIVGLVIRRRGVLGEVGLIRDISKLQQLEWQPAGHQAWAQNIQVVTQTVNGIPFLHVSTDLHMLDFVNQQGRLLVYVFDAATRQLWQPPATQLERAANGQLVLRHNFSAQRFVEVQPGVSFDVPLSELGADPDQLLFRVLLWDVNRTRLLWVSEDWHRAEPARAPIALVPGATPSPTALPPSATPTPNLAATQTAQAEQLATAIAATVAARSPAAATATTTPNFEQLLAAAVDATLTAQAPVAPIATATTKAPTPVPTPNTGGGDLAPDEATAKAPTVTSVACQITVLPELVALWHQAQLGCATTHAQLVWSSWTPYERGQMLWRDDTDKLIYGFFDSGGWQAVSDNWDGQSPTPSRGEPPPGLFEPIRGTGHVWGTNDTFFNELGWAKQPQKGFCATIQNFEHGFILRSNSSVESCKDNFLNNARAGDFGLDYIVAVNGETWHAGRR